MEKNKIHNFINKESFVASKKMGQNFLHSMEIKKRIVESANLVNDEVVIEIGPGLGSITEIILETNHNLLAVELDKRLFVFLKERFANYNNFQIINNDVLKVDLDKILLEKFPKNSNFVMIANLPYSISSKIVLQIMKSELLSRSIIMVQKEMADRICAKYNTPNYNAFSALVDLCLNVKHLFNVGPKNFVPVPKVDSSVIMIEKNKKLPLNDITEIDNFLKLCFHNRRKTLFNNLSYKFDKSMIIEKITALNLDLKIRAQQLPPLVLYEVYKSFYEK